MEWLTYACGAVVVLGIAVTTWATVSTDYRGKRRYKRRH